MPHATIRHKNCELIIPVSSQATRCQFCLTHQKTLLIQCHRLTSSKARTCSNSHVNYHVLTSSEKDIRLRSLHTLVRCNMKQINRLKIKLTAVIESNSISVQPTLYEDLKCIMSKENARILLSFPEGSFGRIFWKQHANGISITER